MPAGVVIEVDKDTPCFKARYVSGYSPRTWCKKDLKKKAIMWSLTESTMNSERRYAGEILGYQSGHAAAQDTSPEDEQLLPQPA